MNEDDSNQGLPDAWEDTWREWLRAGREVRAPKDLWSRIEARARGEERHPWRELLAAAAGFVLIASLTTWKQAPRNRRAGAAELALGIEERASALLTESSVSRDLAPLQGLHEWRLIADLGADQGGGR